MPVEKRSRQWLNFVVPSGAIMSNGNLQKHTIWFRVQVQSECLLGHRHQHRLKQGLSEDMLHRRCETT